LIFHSSRFWGSCSTSKERPKAYRKENNSWTSQKDYRFSNVDFSRKRWKQAIEKPETNNTEMEANVQKGVELVFLPMCIPGTLTPSYNAWYSLSQPTSPLGNENIAKNWVLQKRNHLNEKRLTHHCIFLSTKIPSL
jgi:hypothetical protein